MKSKRLLGGWVLLAPFAFLAPVALADEPPSEPTASTSQAVPVDPQVRAVLVPLFSSIAMADVSRVTVELTAESTLAGEVLNRQTSTYQIASRRPHDYTIYLKEPNQRTRVYGGEKDLIVVMSPQAYVELSDPLSIQDAAISLPVPLGPYPEPILALSLAGVDPAISLFGGMKSVELIDRKPLSAEVPAVHVRGVQNDGVRWDLWVSAEDPPKPLRLLIDLTAMLESSPDVAVPEGFAYQLRMDFLGWRIEGEVSDALFRFKPADGAVKYDSLDAYYQSLAGVTTEHPLLGQPAPELTGKTLGGASVGSADTKEKVVVLDFWATWCEPCLAAVPLIDQVAGSFRQKDVVFYAVNVGEAPNQVKEFVDENEWAATILLDVDESLAESFRADALPQTVVIGKDGVIESVHIGFAGVEALRKRLTDELEVLTVGGKIASASEADAD